MQLHANQTIVILWQLSHTMLQHGNMVRLDKKTNLSKSLTRQPRAHAPSMEILPIKNKHSLYKLGLDDSGRQSLTWFAEVL